MARFRQAQFLLAMLLSPLAANVCLANEPILPDRFGIGREPDPGEILSWDIDISPSGENLPDGQGTVEHGERVYAQWCLACHGPEGANGINDQLVGHFDFENDFAGDTSLPRTIGNFWPYATTLYDYINRSMPMATHTHRGRGLRSGRVSALPERHRRGRHGDRCRNVAIHRDAREPPVLLERGGAGPDRPGRSLIAARSSKQVAAWSCYWSEGNITSLPNLFADNYSGDVLFAWTLRARWVGGA